MSQNRQDFQTKSLTGTRINFSLTNGTGPLDLTNLALRWNLAQFINGPSVLSKTLGAGITVTNPSQGTGYVDIADSDISGYGLYFHNLEVQLPVTGWCCVMNGRGVIDPSISG